jgi:hypothetical protein
MALEHEVERLVDEHVSVQDQNGPAPDAPAVADTARTPQPLFEDAQDERPDELRMVVPVDHYPGHILFLQRGECAVREGACLRCLWLWSLRLLRGRAGFGGTKGYL